MTIRTTGIATILSMIPILAACGQAVPQLGLNSTEDVINAMTIEEKAKLLVGMGFIADVPGLPPLDPEDAKIPEKVPGAAGRTHGIPRLGIPILTLADGPAGIRIDPIRKGDSSRTFHATAFPVATSLASSWDTSLVRTVGAAFGRQAREYGVDILLAPGMNIHRNPLGGRNFEYYSEDPLISGSMAAAFVSGVESEGVGTSIKHLAANNQEFNRLQLNTLVSERALREIYLRGFEIAVKLSQPWTVMSAYNRINGTYSSESRGLLTTILRDEWKFEGLVVTDWFAGTDPVAQVAAGNDLLMPGMPAQTGAIADAAANGTLDVEFLNTSVARVLDVVVKSPAFNKIPFSNKPDLEEGARIARAAAADGMVLLKNDAGVLPLGASASIALFGNASYDLILGGTGSGDVNEAYSVAMVEGLQTADFAIDRQLTDLYTRHIASEKAARPRTMQFFLPPPIPELALDVDNIRGAAQGADVAVVTLGRNSGELSDRPVSDFTLNETERSIVASVSTAFHAEGKPVVIVLNVGGVIEVASWRDEVDAILLAWQPGQEGGNAIADVLRGAVNPSGKLATTFPMSYADVPSARSFPGKVLPGSEQNAGNPFLGVPSEVTYDEGIYVGYRYYNSFGVQPAYEFGYGLSYTDFEYGDLMLSSAEFENEVTATISVTNTGQVAGREVVQLYVSAPSGPLDHPAIELRAFAKTVLLQPGDTQSLAFRLVAGDLASFDSGRSAWIAAPGQYIVKAGSSSLRIHQQASFVLGAEVVVENAHKVLVPDASIEELKPSRRRNADK